MPEHPDLQDEQEFLDRAYDGLEFMRGEARQMLNGVLDLGKGGTFQSRTERDIVVRTSLARLEQLDVGDQALYFGRIDRLPEPGPGGHDGNGHDGHAPLLGESFHIGRLAVSGPDHEPLVVDWRAPVAEPFYRATGLDPQGLARRRHLAVRGRTVLGLEDEYFVDPDGRATAPARDLVGSAGPDGDAAAGPAGERLLADGLVLGGPGALLSALGQARRGHMGDIVATIQREQDEIIRSPLPGVLVVQGGPGTGKTAVALHRAAYLLYTHRFPLERQGVLVVGPNPLFLRYIEQVLPSLGETGVSLSTVAGLVPEVRVRGVDEAAVAKLKGDERMVKVLARALRTRQRPLRHDAEIPFGATVLRLRASTTEDIVALARRRPGPHNARRRFVETQVLRALADDYRARSERGTASSDEPPTQEEQDDLFRRLRRVPDVLEALDRMWPRLSAHEFVHDLLGAHPLLAAAGKGILNAGELQRLFRPRSASLDAVAWTVGDAALVDEARTLLGPRRQRSARTRAIRNEEGVPTEGAFWPAGLAASPVPPGVIGNGAEDETRAFGHIVVDEVQDLSPMQLRMLARRSLSGSMTVVGDIAQATGPWAPASWDDITRHLSPQRPPRLVELTVSYRTPSEVIDVAAQVLAVAAPTVSAPRPVRASGFVPRLVRTSRADLGPQLVDVVRTEVAAVAPGRVAVLGPGVWLPELTRVLDEARLHPVDPREPDGDGLAAGLVVLPADETNGLEFDSVIVVEPMLVAAVEDEPAGEGPPVATTRGLRTLYVAFTRPTRRLTVLSTQPLPVALHETAH